MSDPTTALPNDDDLRECARVLDVLARHPDAAAADTPALTAVRQQAGRLLRALRALDRQEGRRRDAEVLDAALIRHENAGAALPALTRQSSDAGAAILAVPRSCYVCKQPYARVHFFYDCLCPTCARINYDRRSQTADLTGRVALVTGGRIKIGYQIALKLLRASAVVVVTTRFPRDAAQRFAAEADFDAWSSRLTLHGLDLRFLRAVERFADHLLAQLPRLDVLINNAAQTIRRPPAFYRHLVEEAVPDHARQLLGMDYMASSDGPMGHLTPGEVPADLLPAVLSQLPLLPGDERRDGDAFPPGLLDADRQQVDLRDHNTWKMPAGEVSTVELVEVHAINCLAPFLLVSRLEPLLRRRPEVDRYIVNVSAAEGQLNAAWKTANHPHTNMAKAALNMLTRTCAKAYAAEGIFMNSVDTGWISHQAPHPLAERLKADGLRLPLDGIDGAARVLDPVFRGINSGAKIFGQFLKDYHAIPW